MTLTPSGSNSSDYYEPEDPEFIRALQGAVLPGDVIINADEGTTLAPITLVAGTEPRATLKRSRSSSEEIDKSISNTSFHQAPAGNEDDTYGRSHFGAGGEYMWRKRAKLQIQNRAQLDGEDDSEKSRIFEGVSIYVCILAFPLVSVCLWDLVPFRLMGGQSLLCRIYATLSLSMVEYFKHIWTRNR